jgi:hypothetical protein
VVSEVLASVDIDKFPEPGKTKTGNGKSYREDEITNHHCVSHVFYVSYCESAPSV